jgi:hypothetical protein
MQVNNITAGIMHDYLDACNKSGLEATISVSEYLLFRNQAITELKSGLFGPIGENVSQTQESLTVYKNTQPGAWNSTRNLSAVQEQSENIPHSIEDIRNNQTLSSGKQPACANAQPVSQTETVTGSVAENQKNTDEESFLALIAQIQD